MKKSKSAKTVAAGVMAFSLALGGGILATGHANAAAGTSTVQEQKTTEQQGDKLEGLGRFEKQLLTLLKLDAASLKEKLQTQTLAEIAAEQGISKEDLKAKIISWITAEKNAQSAKEKEKQKQADKKKQQELAKQLKNKKLSPKAKQKLEQKFKQEQEQQKKLDQKKEQALKLEAAKMADKLLSFTTESKVDSTQEAPLTGLQNTAEIAKLFNITTTQLDDELKAGKTLTEIAGEYKVETQAVIDLLIAADVKDLDAKLAAGEITQEEYDAQKAAKAEAAAQLLTTKFPGVVQGMEDVEESGKFGDLAKLLGITESELRTAMKSGKSLAAIAEANSKTAQQVVDLLVKDRVAKLDKKLAAGEITKEQYDKYKKSLIDFVTAQVNRVPSPKGTKPESGSKGHGWNFNESQSMMSPGKNK